MKPDAQRLRYTGAVILIVASLLPFLFAGSCLYQLHRDGVVTFTSRGGYGSRVFRGRELIVPVAITAVMGLVFLGTGLQDLRRRIRYNAYQANPDRQPNVLRSGFNRPLAEYAVRTKSARCVVGLLIGLGMILLGLDLHVFRTARWNVDSSHWGWMFLCGLGALLAVGALKEWFAPTALLLANAQGITLYVAGPNWTWNPSTRSFDVTRRRGTPCLIPWSKITYLGPGTIEKGGRKDAEMALKVLCDPTVRLDGCEVRDVLEAWTGFPGEDFKQLCREDQQTLLPEHLLSGFALNARHLPDPLPETIAILEQIRPRRT